MLWINLDQKCKQSFWCFQWIQDGSPSNSGTSVKLENPNQFAPQGADPHEFKKKQKNVSIIENENISLYIVKRDEKKKWAFNKVSFIPLI